MLKSIHIENYALINTLDIEFGEGLSIITGETGAGKSILLGALGLALGQRADLGAIKNKEKNCIIEVTFEVNKTKYEPLFAKNDVDFEPTAVFRRVINVSGKSRAFINDMPVTVSQLKNIGERLVDIHSQHQNMLLANTSFQKNVVDISAKNEQILREYQSVYDDFKKTEKQLNELQSQAEQAKADYDYLSFQNQKFEEAKLDDANEQELLENEQQELTHAEEIKTAYATVAAMLSGEENSVGAILREALSILKKIAEFSKSAQTLTERTESCRIELQDIDNEIERENESTGLDAERLTFVENRLNTIYDLQQKHHVGSIAELISIHQNIKEKLDAVENFDGKVMQLQTLYNKQLALLKNCSQQLTTSRKAEVKNIETNVCRTLNSLGMPNAALNIDIAESPNFMRDGKDNISFLFSANKEIAPQEISKVASGGEMSRLMLALKGLVIKSGMFPTIIFDEIDTGISGNVADKTGEIINELAQNSQIINITHLPQIASKGAAHYLVYKQEKTDTTTTNIRKLNSEERIMEIAKMLSGSNITQAAIDNAKELLKR